MACQPNYVLCPPMPAHIIEPPQPQFYKAPLPVSADMDGDGEMRSLTRLSFDDYSRMSLQACAVRSHQRRCPTPDWAMAESSTRRVILAFMESRAYSKKQRALLSGLTERERLVAVIQKLKSQRDARVRVLDGLCNQFVSCTDPERRKALTVQIKNLDRVIQLIGRPDVFYELVVAYHRERLDSVGVAERCGLSPWGVRALLYRMNKAASGLGYVVEFSKPRVRLTPEQQAWVDEQKRLAKSGRLAAREARWNQRLAERRSKVLVMRRASIKRGQRGLPA